MTRNRYYGALVYTMVFGGVIAGVLVGVAGNLLA